MQTTNSARGLATALGAAIALLGSPRSLAQEPAGLPRVGVFLWHESPNDDATLAGVRQGLREAGHGVDFVVRRAASDPATAERMLRELDTMRCRLVLALGTRSTQLAQKHLQRTPIVFAAVTNPVTAGIVTDWRDCGRGLAGASNWIAPQSVLDVFRLAVPGLRRLGMLRSRASGTVSEAERTGMQRYLATPGAPDVTLHEAVVRTADDIDRAVAELCDRGVDAIWIPIDLTIYRDVPRIERALGDRTMPLLTTAAAGVRNGALVGAAVDYRLHGRRAATLIRRALHDGQVSDHLPVDRMRSSLVVVNLAAAQKGGIELPLSLLAVADELIAPEER